MFGFVIILIYKDNKHNYTYLQKIKDIYTNKFLKYKLKIYKNNLNLFITIYYNLLLFYMLSCLIKFFIECNNTYNKKICIINKIFIWLNIKNIQQFYYCKVNNKSSI